MRKARIRDSRCKLFVGNIPNEITRDQLRHELERLSGKTFADFRHKKGYCFLGFKSPEDANTAKLNLKNACCRGKCLNVELKKEGPIRNDNKYISILEQAERTLYVRDIPCHTNPDNFRKIFEQFGKIRKFTLPTEKLVQYYTHKKSDGYSFIEYFLKDDCDKALRCSKSLMIDEQEVEVRISDPPKENVRNRRNVSEHDDDNDNQNEMEATLVCMKKKKKKEHHVSNNGTGTTTVIPVCTMSQSPNGNCNEYDCYSNATENKASLNHCNSVCLLGCETTLDMPLSAPLRRYECKDSSPPSQFHHVLSNIPSHSHYSALSCSFGTSSSSIHKLPAQYPLSQLNSLSIQDESLCKRHPFYHVSHETLPQQFIKFIFKQIFFLNYLICNLMYRQNPFNSQQNLNQYFQSTCLISEDLPQACKNVVPNAPSLNFIFKKGGQSQK
ncbi:heterogeneous nuclear ribonucleoprotein A0 [Reticulomyxa filosa]|uniref:Heterogeneous nuclear ribonucleoprotein A0 n=1 Tax=Reticulomyxa filosa TaxID=46433 RepID=X6NAN1_RETFI|nr:heterogeneous nuclear ribonucleoprotein A0 [Reticulomyxa filosa]|eukprot:ETO22824.1 heterogeneous nuclear ribonucleoprotein A0 [Reticulomyxa filosa]